MLTPARRRPRALLALVTFFGVLASLLIMTHAQAEPGEGADTTVASSAEVSEGGCSVPPGHYESVWNAEKNRLETITVCPPTGGENGTGDGGGGNEPTCEFYQNYDEWCEGTAACWGNNPAANQPEDLSPRTTLARLRRTSTTWPTRSAAGPTARRTTTGIGRFRQSRRCGNRLRRPSPTSWPRRSL